MYEGENQIVFSEETAKRVFSGFMSKFLNSPVVVTHLDSDYKGLTINFTDAIEVGKAEKAEVPSTNLESEV